MDADPNVELELAMRRIRRRVEERRRQGQYLSGIEAELEEDFHQALDESSGAAALVREAAEALGALRAAQGFGVERIERSSAMPGGSAVHGAIGKAVGRQTAGALWQVGEYRGQLEGALGRVAVALEALAEATVRLEARVRDLERR